MALQLSLFYIKLHLSITWSGDYSPERVNTYATGSDKHIIGWVSLRRRSSGWGRQHAYFTQHTDYLPELNQPRANPPSQGPLGHHQRSTLPRAPTLLLEVIQGKVKGSMKVSCLRVWITEIPVSVLLEGPRWLVKKAATDTRGVLSIPVHLPALTSGLWTAQSQAV